MEEDVALSYARLRTVVGGQEANVNCIGLNDATDTILQVAGSCVIVKSASDSRSTEGHLVANTKNVFSCVAVSHCGRFAATGEKGQNPCVRVWKLRDDQGHFVGRLIRSLSAHTEAINLIRFTPDDSTLISVGCHQDSQIIAWDWRNGNELGVGKLMSTVYMIVVSFDSSMCVTVGVKSVKYWFLPLASNGVNKRSGLTSRSAILADKRNVTFVDAAFCDSSNRLATVTSTGEIVEFNANKKYVKSYTWQDQHFKATSLTRIPEGLLVGCSDGLVRLYCLTGDDLDFLADLPSPTHLFVDPSSMYDTLHLQSHQHGAIYPAVRCLVSTPTSTSFVAGYADRSVIQYARNDHQWAFRSASLAHIGAVNCVEMSLSSSPCVPQGTFVTAGRDSTIRLWNMSPEAVDEKDFSNLLCPHLLKVIYLDEDRELLLDRSPSDAIDEERPDDTGIVYAKVSRDGRLLAAANASGTLFLIDLTFTDMPILDVINAHDGVITTIDFSMSTSRDTPQLLASGGNDRFVHIFRRMPFTTQFVHCAVLDAHDSAIKKAQFAMHMGKLHLYTASNDKTLIIWRLDLFDEEHCEFSLVQQISTPSPICDMTIAKNHRNILVVCQDKIVHVFDLNGRRVREMRGAEYETRKIVVDPSDTYVASVTDRNVVIRELKTSKPVANFSVSSVLDAAFSHDFRNMVVTSSDGSIFIWKLARNLTERMVSAQVVALEEANMRTSTPDSVIGSGSDTLSEDYSKSSRPLGPPDFGGSDVSLFSSSGGIEGDDEGHGSHFSSVETRHKKRERVLIGLTGIARVGDSSYSPSVQTAPVVERRTSSNLFAHDHFDTDASETQSDFVTSRRTNRLFDENPDEILSAVGSIQDRHLDVHEAHRGASPQLLSNRNIDQLREYQSSKSMMNLRDAGEGGRVQTARELMMSHIAAQRTGASANGGSSNRMKWGDMAPVQQNAWVSSSTDLHHVSPVMATRSQNYAFEIPPPPLAPRTTSRVLSTPPSQNALSQIQTNSQFRRKSVDRNSLSRKFLDNGGSQPRTVWTPQTLSTSSAPRRSNSNLFAASMAEGSQLDLARRPNDLKFSSHEMRSRSQSPNKLALNQLLRDGRRSEVPSSPSSTVGSSVVGARSLHQKRRDSDMSYIRSTSRGPTSRDGEMRKSTDALNKLMSVRSKLHQSSESLRKSTDNLMHLQQQEDNATSTTRTRSSSNLRSLGGAMESSRQAFDADARIQSGSTNSLAQSRMLARSMNSVHDNASLESSTNRDYESPSKRLAHTIQMMRKASNPDLTAPEQFEDSGSPYALRMRGAVQKKVDRYRPRNKSGAAGRNQTSEESDSNASDMSPFSINKRALAAGNSRSTTTSDWSPASSARSSSLATGAIGTGVPSSRRLYDTQRISATTPRRTGGNYLVTKMTEAMNKSMEGPDLGSDESPRSSVNPYEWQNLIELLDDGTRNPLVYHVKDCMEQLRIHIDKFIQAKKLVEVDTSLPVEQRKIVLSELERSMEKAVEKLNPPSSKDDDRQNGNNNNNVSSKDIYGIPKENLTSRQ